MFQYILLLNLLSNFGINLKLVIFSFPSSRYGMAVHSAILTQWSALMGHLKKGCEPELQSFALLLLRKLLQIDAKVVYSVYKSWGGFHNELRLVLSRVRTSYSS